MAGIGFELRKIFKENTIVSMFKGFTSASFIAAGPMIISIILLISIDKILKSANVNIDEREIIKAAILYAYVFSMIVSSGFNMIISRYISDKLFVNNIKDILSSLIGIIATVLIFAGLISIVLYFKSPLPFLQKYFSYAIFIELVILNILMAYISAIKNYKQVVLSFVLGSITTILITFFLTKSNTNIVTGTIFSVSVGYFINIIILILALTQHFNILSKNLFSFIKYFGKHYKLFLINFFYTLGVFIHNIIFWKFSNLSVNIKDTFVYAPPYDTASFLQF